VVGLANVVACTVALGDPALTCTLGDLLRDPLRLTVPVGEIAIEWLGEVVEVRVKVPESE
jgi:hypothetical protein